MKVKYSKKGPKGKTCSVCKHFKKSKGSSKVGSCFGHKVVASGHCNYFKKK